MDPDTQQLVDVMNFQGLFIPSSVTPGPTWLRSPGRLTGDLSTQAAVKISLQVVGQADKIKKVRLDGVSALQGRNVFPGQ